MKKIILSVIMLISMLFLSSCSPVYLMPRGGVVLYVITTEEKDESDKKYYAVYRNGGYLETDRFKPDDVTEYHVDTNTFSSKIVANGIVNEVVMPVVRDNNDAPVKPDDRILGIIYAAANKIKHSIWRFEIFNEGDKYFVFIWLNVNLVSPCELYEYDIDNKTIHQLCEWDEVDIVGISVPGSAREINSFDDKSLGESKKDSGQAVFFA